MKMEKTSRGGRRNKGRMWAQVDGWKNESIHVESEKENGDRGRRGANNNNVEVREAKMKE